MGCRVDWMETLWVVREENAAILNVRTSPIAT